MCVGPTSKSTQSSPFHSIPTRTRQGSGGAPCTGLRMKGATAAAVRISSEVRLSPPLSSPSCPGAQRPSSPATATSVVEAPPPSSRWRPQRPPSSRRRRFPLPHHAGGPDGPRPCDGDLNGGGSPSPSHRQPWRPSSPRRRDDYLRGGGLPSPDDPDGTSAMVSQAPLEPFFCSVVIVLQISDLGNNMDLFRQAYFSLSNNTVYNQ
jgi:hypothetical protein